MESTKRLRMIEGSHLSTGVRRVNSIRELADRQCRNGMRSAGAMRHPCVSRNNST